MDLLKRSVDRYCHGIISLRGVFLRQKGGKQFPVADGKSLLQTTTEAGILLTQEVK